MSDSLCPHELYSPWNSPGQNTGMGRLSLLQGIFPTQGSNPGLPHCRQILYQLSHKGRKSLKSNWNISKTLEMWPPPSDPGWVAIKGVLDGIWDNRGWVKLNQKLWALGNRSTPPNFLLEDLFLTLLFHNFYGRDMDTALLSQTHKVTLIIGDLSLLPAAWPSFKDP